MDYFTQKNGRNVYTNMVKYNELSTKDEMQRDSLKDRSTVIPVETSIEYLKSDGMKLLLHIQNKSINLFGYLLIITAPNSMLMFFIF